MQRVYTIYNNAIRITPTKTRTNAPRLNELRITILPTV